MRSKIIDNMPDLAFRDEDLVGVVVLAVNKEGRVAVSTNYTRDSVRRLCKHVYENNDKAIQVETQGGNA